MGEVRDIRDVESLAVFAAELLHDDRPRPVALVSARDVDEPWLDIEALCEQVGDDVDVVLVQNGHLTWELGDLLPYGTNVFGDAVRLYPTGAGWQRTPAAAQLFVDGGRHDTATLVTFVVASARALVARPDETVSELPASVVAAAAGNTPASVLRRARREAHSSPEDDDAGARERDQLAADLVRTRAALERAREDVTKLRKRLKAAEKVSPVTCVHAEEAFTDPVEQFEHEVYLAWVAQVPAAEKAARPLPKDWRVGERFLASLDSAQGVSRDKVLEVVVHVLTGMDSLLAGRDLHRLRTGTRGAEPYWEREPGEFCWRVSLQSNTPSARRLHYWRDGERIELSRVVLHDDVAP